MLGEEWVTLDLLSAVDSQSQCGVASEETSEKRASVGRDLVAELEGVGQDLRRRRRFEAQRGFGLGKKNDEDRGVRWKGAITF